MGTAARARDTGHPSFAALAWLWNASSERPGTTARVTSSIPMMDGPPSRVSRVTRASVWIRSGGWPAVASRAASAIEKHPACAAAMSSSGLVPTPSSKREPKEYDPSTAPLAVARVPLPLLRSPRHSASAVRTGIVDTPLGRLRIRPESTGPDRQDTERDAAGRREAEPRGAPRPDRRGGGAGPTRERARFVAAAPLDPAAPRAYGTVGARPMLGRALPNAHDAGEMHAGSAPRDPSGRAQHTGGRSDGRRTVADRAAADRP